jgi:hypothetical protein
LLHAVNTTCGVNATSVAILIALALTTAPAMGTPYPDAANVVAAYLTARSWIDDFDLPAPADEAASITLGDATGVCVILRHGGRVIGIGTDTTGNQLMVRRAIGRALSEVLGDPAVASLPTGGAESPGRALTLQLEVAGALVPLIGRSFADIAGQLDPGLDGVAIRRGQQLAMLFPARVRANNTAGRLERLLPALAVEVGLAVMPLPELAQRFDVSLYRFRTIDLAQAAPRRPPHQMTRGDVLVLDEAVTRESIEHLARGIADHLAASIAQVGEPVGLMGTYQPSSDRYEPLIAPPLEQGLAAWALSRYGRLPNLDAESATRAHALAARILEDLSVIAPGETDPLAGAVACSAIVHAALEHPTYLAGDLTPRLFLEAAARVRSGWTRHDGFIDIDEQVPVPPHARALIASAMSRLLASDITAIDDSTARGALDAAWESVPPHGQVALLPWIGWGEADYAAATGRPVAAVRLRALRDLLDAARLDHVSLIKTGGTDLAGGFDLSRRRSGLATSQTLRPAAMLAWMIRQPDFTAPEDASLALGRMLQTMRFITQLAVRDSLLWSCPDPDRATGGIRQATWDWDQPIPAQALALVTATEMLLSLQE